MADGIVKLMLYLARAIFIFLGGVAGYQVVRIAVLQEWWPKGAFHFSFIPFFFGVLLFALIGYLITPFFVRLLGFIALSFEKNLETLSWHDISVALAGLIAGLIVANLAALPFADLPVVGSYMAVLLNVVLGYLGATLFLKRKEEIHGMWSSIGGLKQRFSIRGKRTKESGDNNLTELAIEPGNERPAVKLLDTSVIIDGRILEIAATGFLEGPFILPRFILNELQAIADSSDPTRRTKGRRGLDIINELRQLSEVTVQILEVTLKDFDVGSVDEGLVDLAKEINAKVITTDYNLNKIAQIQGVSVLNVNELANAMKPTLLPGESITVDVLREGKEPQQGVGYLDDGTMIVVENGEDYIGKRVEVVVTSMLQTSAGRMVFGRIRKEVRP
ncbi:MAG: TRAM domain-containing protein [Thermovirga sp.]|nr:TRAM domain-containing protein [Thermovirga sp.]